MKDAVAICGHIHWHSSTSSSLLIVPCPPFLSLSDLVTLHHYIRITLFSTTWLPVFGEQTISLSPPPRKRQSTIKKGETMSEMVVLLPSSWNQTTYPAQYSSLQQVGHRRRGRFEIVDVCHHASVAGSILPSLISTMATTNLLHQLPLQRLKGAGKVPQQLCVSM